MEDNEVYSAPQADLDNVLDEQRIGGWLRCFQVLNYIGLILSVVVVLALFAAEALIGGMFEHMLDIVALLIEIAPPILFSYLIIKCLPVASADTPEQIKKLLGYYLAVSLVIGFSLTMAHKSGYITDKPSPFIGDLIYYAIWASYFKKSKRVKEFYGANAP